MLAHWKKSSDKSRQCTKKQKHYLANKGLYSQSYGFSSSHVRMWELNHKKGWVPKNWFFWIGVLEKILRVPWTARRSNQSNLKEINPECALEGPMLKLKLQYFGHLMRRSNSLEKTMMLGKIESKRRRGQQSMRCLDSITTKWTWIWQTLGDSEGQGSLACCSPWSRKKSDATYQLNNNNNQFSSVQSLSRVQLFVTPRTAASQASQSFTVSWSLLKFMSFELVMPSNHVIFCRPLLLLLSIFPSIWVFSNESALCIRWPSYWSLSFNISPSNEYSESLLLVE